MDPLKAKDYDQSYKNQNTPIVCTQDEGKILIQLEGSHTTSTTTETPPNADKKNVKFEDVKEKERNTNEAILPAEEFNLNEMKLIEALSSETTKADFCKYLVTHQLEPSSSNSALDLKTFKEKITQQQDIELRHLRQAAENAKKPSHFRSISTVTISCDFRSVACQTQLSDLISLNELSLMEISSLTSRSEQTNSLNNYAQAENACISNYGSQHEIIKRPSFAPIVQQTVALPPDTQEPPRVPSFNIITIEADSTPSLTELRRLPLCHRVWDVFCDVCAATFLCLQVNRDCIFCLGFFAAFVVSASFLTAFFYHTLVMSPALWPSTENSHF